MYWLLERDAIELWGSVLNLCFASLHLDFMVNGYFYSVNA